MRRAPAAGWSGMTETRDMIRHVILTGGVSHEDGHTNSQQRILHFSFHLSQLKSGGSLALGPGYASCQVAPVFSLELAT